MPLEESWKDWKHKMKQALHANCAICPLADILNTQVSSMGPLDPKAIVVLDTPSRSDAAVGTLMSGEGGMVLRTLLKDNGLHPRDDVYYTSAAMCWPRRKGLSIEEAGEVCRKRLQYTLQQLPPAPVLALGSLARQAMGFPVVDKMFDRGLGTLNPEEVLANPKKMVHLEMAVKKFAAGKKWTGQYPGAMHYELDPYPLPEIDQHYGIICIDIEANSTKWYQDNSHIFLVGIATEIGERWIFTDEYMQTSEFHAWLRAFWVVTTINTTVSSRTDSLGPHCT
jgi:uracil-DNA glycosylase family 4